MISKSRAKSMDDCGRASCPICGETPAARFDRTFAFVVIVAVVVMLLRSWA